MWNIKKLEKQKTGKLEYQKTRKLKNWKSGKVENWLIRKPEKLYGTRKSIFQPKITENDQNLQNENFSQVNL